MTTSGASRVYPYDFQGRLRTWTELCDKNLRENCGGLLQKYGSADPSLTVLENIEADLRKLQLDIQDYKGPHVQQNFVKIMETINDMKGALDKVDVTGSGKRRLKRAEIQSYLTQEAKNIERKITCKRGNCDQCEHVKMLSK